MKKEGMQTPLGISNHGKSTELKIIQDIYQEKKSVLVATRVGLVQLGTKLGLLVGVKLRLVVGIKSELSYNKLLES